MLPKQITSPKLLLVEGNDDVGFFEKIRDEIRIDDLQIHPMGGKDEFKVPNLASIRKMESFRLVRCLAIARDADKDAEQAFRSVCSVLAGAHLPCPARTMGFEGTTKFRVGVLIIPPNAKEGRLEELCLSSIENFRQMGCIDDFFQCIGKKVNEFPEDLPKAKIQAFLASREKSVPHLGVGIERGYFPLNSEVFEEIKVFLKSM
jgi:hypothetical protein